MVQAQFTFTTNNGAITITGSTGPGGDVTIPDTINGLPVTSIGDFAFAGCTNLTSVAMGNSVINLGVGAFEMCTNLPAITVDVLNPVYSSAAGVLFNKNQTTLDEYPAGKAATPTRSPTASPASRSERSKTSPACRLKASPG